MIGLKMMFLLITCNYWKHMSVDFPTQYIIGPPTFVFFNVK